MTISGIRLLTPLKPGKGRNPNGLEFIRGLIVEQEGEEREERGERVKLGRLSRSEPLRGGMLRVVETISTTLGP
jgi:hypothetical protein